MQYVKVRDLIINGNDSPQAILVKTKLIESKSERELMMITLKEKGQCTRDELRQRFRSSNQVLWQQQRDFRGASSLQVLPLM